MTQKTKHSLPNLAKGADMRITSLTAIITILCFAFVISSAKADNHANPDNRIEKILNSQQEATKARYKYRNPKETLQFLGIKQGMTVAEVLPGRGWYTKILLPLLGKDGQLVGIDYNQKMWPNFRFANEQFIERKKIWVETWTRGASEWATPDSARISAYQFGQMPENLKGTADAVLFIRALHHLVRLNDKGNYLTQALQETYDILKPGGIVGIVQHHAQEDRPDKWADGNNGYLKKSLVIKAMQDKGFKFVGESDINANPKDQAGPGDVVWRLPPSLRGSKDDAKKRTAMLAIGESNRMTLKFIKPLEK
jgi:predicted methyltransferase